MTSRNLDSAIVEEIKACVPTSITTYYIDEQKATTFHQATILADDYSLTHRNAFPSTNSIGSRDDKSVTPPNHPKTGRYYINMAMVDVRISALRYQLKFLCHNAACLELRYTLGIGYYIKTVKLEL